MPGNSRSTFCLHEFDYLGILYSWNHAYLPAWLIESRGSYPGCAAKSPEELWKTTDVWAPEQEILSHRVWGRGKNSVLKKPSENICCGRKRPEEENLVKAKWGEVEGEVNGQQGGDPGAATGFGKQVFIKSFSRGIRKWLAEQILWDTGKIRIKIMGRKGKDSRTSGDTDKLFDRRDGNGVTRGLLVAIA